MHPKTKPLMEDLTVCSAYTQCRVSIHDPVLLTSETPCIRFTVSIESQAGVVVMSVPGFRLAKSTIMFPARKTFTKWVPTAILATPILDMLKLMVQRWRDDFPTVEFPLAGPL